MAGHVLTKRMEVLRRTDGSMGLFPSQLAMPAVPRHSRTGLGDIDQGQGRWQRLGAAGRVGTVHLQGSSSQPHRSFWDGSMPGGVRGSESRLERKWAHANRKS